MDIEHLFTRAGYAMIERRCARILVSLVAGTLLLPLAELQGQRRGVPDLRNASYLGLGYVGNIPDAMVGGAILALTPKVFGGAGLYADVKFSPTTPARAEEYDSTITVDQADNQYADLLVVEESAWVTVNLALVYAVTAELALYAGAGYARENHYRQYFDDAQIRGLEGFYWIRDPAASGGRVNALGGVLLRAGRHVAFQMGLEAQPRGADVGVMITFPL